MATTLMISPALQLGSGDLTSGRLRTELHFDGPFLPINATFANILQFMGIVAQGDFEDLVLPRVYYSSRYPQVIITNHSSTKARFLLDGIYCAAVDMVKFSRFNNVVIKIFWNNDAVGKISLRVLDSLDPTAKNTDIVMDDGEALSPEDVGKGTAQTLSERLGTPLAGNGTGNITIKRASVVNAVKEWATALGNWSTPSARISNSPFSVPLAIRFAEIIGAHALRRNDVYLVFYVAMLHVAKFPVRDKLQHFTIPSPVVDLGISMYPTTAECSVRSQYLEAITTLTYVPVYMMEHPEIAFKETAFNVFLNGVRACKGSVLDTAESTGVHT